MPKVALELVLPDMTVMINDRSTAAALGACSVENHTLTVITNNASFIKALKDKERKYATRIDGQYSSMFKTFFEILAETAITSLSADITFACSPAVFDTEPLHMDGIVVQAKRAIIVAGTRTCLLVHHARFGRTELHKLADLSAFDAVILDATPAEYCLAATTQASPNLTAAHQ